MDVDNELHEFADDAEDWLCELNAPPENALDTTTAPNVFGTVEKKQKQLPTNLPDYISGIVHLLT
jgi:hypothetical protein